MNKYSNNSTTDIVPCENFLFNMLSASCGLSGDSPPSPPEGQGPASNSQKVINNMGPVSGAVSCAGLVSSAMSGAGLVSGAALVSGEGFMGLGDGVYVGAIQCQAGH
jgi:hypothetical protein